jgi:hypothetical protein
VPEIGRQFGGKHHSVEKIAEARKTDKDSNKLFASTSPSPLPCLPDIRPPDVPDPQLIAVSAHRRRSNCAQAEEWCCYASSSSLLSS